MPFHFLGKMSLPQTVYFSISNFLYKLTQPTVHTVYTGQLDQTVKSNKSPIDLIALQEIWNIQNLPSVEIPSYNFVFKKRSKFRGGGVGFLH